MIATSYVASSGDIPPCPSCGRTGEQVWLLVQRDEGHVEYGPCSKCRNAEAPLRPQNRAIALTLDKPPAPVLRGGHVHQCPSCHEDRPCEDACSCEPCMDRGDGMPRGHQVECSKCRNVTRSGECAKSETIQPAVSATSWHGEAEIAPSNEPAKQEEPAAKRARFEQLSLFGG